jgi:hypothetical protein
MYQLLSLVLQAVLIGDLHLYCCEGIRSIFAHVKNFILVYSTSVIGASITLSPSGMVSVCPGGQILLICERMSGFFLHWNVTVHVPHLATREVIVSIQGAVRQFNGADFSAFTVTRTCIWKPID